MDRGRTREDGVAFDDDTGVRERGAVDGRGDQSRDHAFRRFGRRQGRMGFEGADLAAGLNAALLVARRDRRAEYRHGQRAGGRVQQSRVPLLSCSHGELAYRV